MLVVGQNLSMHEVQYLQLNPMLRHLNMNKCIVLVKSSGSHSFGRSTLKHGRSRRNDVHEWFLVLLLVAQIQQRTCHWSKLKIAVLSIFRQARDISFEASFA